MKYFHVEMRGVKMKNANETFFDGNFFFCRTFIGKKKFERISVEIKIKLFHFLAFQHSFGCWWASGAKIELLF